MEKAGEVIGGVRKQFALPYADKQGEVLLFDFLDRARARDLCQSLNGLAQFGLITFKLSKGIEKRTIWRPAQKAGQQRIPSQSQAVLFSHLSHGRHTLSCVAASGDRTASLRKRDIHRHCCCSNVSSFLQFLAKLDISYRRRSTGRCQKGWGTLGKGYLFPVPCSWPSPQRRASAPPRRGALSRRAAVTRSVSGSSASCWFSATPSACVSTCSTASDDAAAAI